MLDAVVAVARMLEMVATDIIEAVPVAQAQV